MRAVSGPFQSVYLLIESNLPRNQAISLILDTIETEIITQAQDHNQLFLSTQSRLQYLFSIGKISKDLYQKISQIKFLAGIPETQDVLNSLIAIWVQLIASYANTEIPGDLRGFAISTGYSEGISENATDPYIKSTRISIIKMDDDTDRLHFIFEKGTLEIQQLALADQPEKNRKLIRQALKYIKPPFDVYVHQFTKKEECWNAEDIIILPDFLIDVTAIASCYNSGGINPFKHLIHLFYYTPAALSTLVGTSVNQFLDELILFPELSFEELSKNIFQHNPIAFSLLNDSEALKYQESIKLHFNNILKIVQSKFNHLVDELENCLMEPSFYAVEYGIQGRLDVYYEDVKTQRKLIVELKSGKPYLSNKYGLNAEHHAQIMLYYLMIQSVYGSYQQVNSMLLYSSQSENALRNAPVMEEIRQELIQLRNSIILLHLHLAFRNPEDPFILDLISDKQFGLSESYTKRDAGIVLNIYSKLTPIEKEYFKELSGFIAREQFIAKMGRSNTQYTEGLASLWLLNEREKLNNFMIVPGLTIREIKQEKGEFPILILCQKINSDSISTFRTGDTLVLYSGASALKEQIYKCILIDQFPNEYHIRLRSRQFPNGLIIKDKTWNLEHDSLDRSFINQFQGLLEFSQAEPEIRQRIMGLSSPRSKIQTEFPGLQEAPEIIRPVLHKIVLSNDYFLLWGPPGSGKTSMVIKHLTRILLTDTSEHILLLAYTNRAVDEICEAIKSIESEQTLDFIRIGSRYAVAPKYRKYLLEEKISTFNKRLQLLQLLNKTRIFTATIASIQGKKELFLLKKFHTVIIDEASQILESQLSGLLPKFERFILIGDHMQLPAVSAQTDDETIFHSRQLQDAGFQSLNMSLFERMLQQCRNKNWNHAFEMLTFQGRMHEEIMKFPANAFYENKLRILPGKMMMRQSSSYYKAFEEISNQTDRNLATHRTIFIHCENPDSILSSKTNLAEAKRVSALVKNLYELYQKNNKEWNESTLGIITPFRAQISQIKKQIHQDEIGFIPVTVDTAERYQGSTRDIIIISTVISEENQLPQINSLNQNGTDRKLNVALTRAKEQIILIGNQRALLGSPVYSQLIQEYWKFEEA